MTLRNSAKLLSAFCISICVFTPALSGPVDDPEETMSDPKSDEQGIPNRDYSNIPSNWNAYFMDEETRDSYTGEKAKKVCMDDDFAAMPQVYDSVNLKISNNPEMGRGRFITAKLLYGGQDFMVIDENHLVLSMPLAGNYLIETRGCKRNLDRAKYLRFSDEIGRRSVNRCLIKRGGLGILTRYKSGFKTCEIRSIYEWDGPLPLDDQILDVDLPPIELK